MKLGFLVLHFCVRLVFSSVVDRQLLTYAPTPDGLYTPPADSTTLLDLVKARPNLTNLTSILEQAAGFVEAFNTPASWNFTFFAPSDEAFTNVGEYFNTYAATLKGKWWLGNLIQHHYVPNTALKLSSFNSTELRFQTGSFLYVKAEVQDYRLVLNDAALVTEADIAVTNVSISFPKYYHPNKFQGIVHIIDHILDPSAQIFEGDLPKFSQSFIAGSCSNTALSYC